MPVTPERKGLMKTLITSSFDQRLLGRATEDKQLATEIIKKLGIWREFVGATKDLDGKGVKVAREKDYLVMAHPEITLSDLDNIILLYTRHELPDIKYDHYVNFCPAYMSEVIEAYQGYKMEVLAPVGEKLLSEPPETPPITPEQNAEAMREMIWKCYRLVHENENILLFAGIIVGAFDYLYRSKNLIITKELSAAAKAYATARIETLDMTAGKKNMDGALKQIVANDHQGKKGLHYQFSAFYCLREFFKSISPEAAAELVQVKHFIK